MPCLVTRIKKPLPPSKIFNQGYCCKSPRTFVYELCILEMSLWAVNHCKVQKRERCSFLLNRISVGTYGYLKRIVRPLFWWLLFPKRVPWILKILIMASIKLSMPTYSLWCHYTALAVWILQWEENCSTICTLRWILGLQSMMYLQHC